MQVQATRDSSRATEGMRVRLTGRYSACALLLAVFVSACGSAATSPTPSPGAKPLKISMVVGFAGLPFYTAMQCGAQDAAKELGNITLSVQGPTTFSVELQIPIVNAVVASKPDGLFLVPTDPRALVVPTQQAINAGIAVVTADNSLEQPIDLANFAADNQLGGKQAGQAMLDLLQGQHGTILVIDNATGNPVTNSRAKGFIDALAVQSALTVLPVQYQHDSVTTAATITQATLQAHPDLRGIFNTNETGANGAAAALRGSPAKGVVKVIAYDSDEAEVRALRDGTFDALVAQGSYSMGHDGTVLLAKYLRGQIKKSDITYKNIAANVIVTKSNVDDPQVKKLFYPSSCP